jgi:hypothetical protein
LQASTKFVDELVHLAFLKQRRSGEAQAGPRADGSPGTTVVSDPASTLASAPAQGGGPCRCPPYDCTLIKFGQSPWSKLVGAFGAINTLSPAPGAFPRQHDGIHPAVRVTGRPRSSTGRVDGGAAAVPLALAKHWWGPANGRFTAVACTHCALRTCRTVIRTRQTGSGGPLACDMRTWVPLLQELPPVFRATGWPRRNEQT